MISLCIAITRPTTDDTDLLDISEDVCNVVRDSGVSDGLVILTTGHALVKCLSRC